MTPAQSSFGSQPQRSFPPWIRWAAGVWLVIWVPAYWHAWGPANFLHLCDLAVFITCVGLWTNSSLLLSSQAVGSLLVDLAWTLDAAWKLVAHHHLIGGTEYLFDPSIALWIRLLSLFHVALPPILLWALSRTGYDRRGWALQCAIATAAFVVSRFTNAGTNINFAFTDPFWHRSVGPSAVHVAASILFMAIVVYLPTHLVLTGIYGQPRTVVSESAPRS
jgi:hypothetical protein